MLALSEFAGCLLPVETRIVPTTPHRTGQAIDVIIPMHYLKKHPINTILPMKKYIISGLAAALVSLTACSSDTHSKTTTTEQTTVPGPITTTTTDTTQSK